MDGGINDKNNPAFEAFRYRRFHGGHRRPWYYQYPYPAEFLRWRLRAVQRLRPGSIACGFMACRETMEPDSKNPDFLHPSDSAPKGIRAIGYS
jgi:hypothetical protein